MGINGKNDKIIAIVGPHASGKTSLSIKLSLWLKNVEIISADSRQVYKGLDIGSGKIKKEEMMGVPHHLIDVASPKRIFTVSEYQKKAFKKIEEIKKRGNIPLLVGGTGFYVDSVIKNTTFPEVKPNWKLRKELYKKEREELFLILKKLDKERASNIDRKNKRRIIRAIEIIKETKAKVPRIEENPIFDSIVFGVKRDKEKLNKLIEKRLKSRLKEGVIEEVETLHKKGLSWKRLEELGLEYRYVALYLQNKLSYKEMINSLDKEIKNYAKRQMTWFKRNKVIWIKDLKEIKLHLKRYLS